MEVVGAVAAIVQLVDLTRKIASFLGDVKHAPREIGEILADVYAASPIFLKLYLAVQNQEGEPSAQWRAIEKTLCCEGGPLYQAREAAGDLEERLNALKARKWTMGLQWTREKKALKEARDRIIRMQQLVDLALQGNLLELAHELKQDVQHIPQLALDVAEIRALASRTNATLEENIDEWRTDELYTNIERQLCPTDFTSKKQSMLETSQTGSCSWFLDSSEYRQWLDSQSSVLFCPGIPGAGKTVLAAIVSDNLQKLCQTNDDVQSAVVFCDFKQVGEHHLEAFVASIWYQLFKRRKASPLERNQLHHQIIIQPPRLNQLVELLQREIRRYRQVYLVVDALDECNEQIRDDFALKLFEIDPRLSVMITARYFSEPVKAQQADMGRLGLELKIRAASEDISSYIRTQLSQNRKLQRHTVQDKTLAGDIERKITETANGMFLMAKLHLDVLASKHTARLARNALNVLPAQLQDTYDLTLQRIEAQSEDDRNLAMRVIQWLCASKTAMTADEILWAFATIAGDDDLDENNLLSVHLLTEVCQGLVTVDPSNNAIRFVHFTTQEYFEKFTSEQLQEIWADIATTCVSYLHFKRFASGFAKFGEHLSMRFNQDRFLRFAATRWGEFARLCNSADVTDMVMDLLQDEKYIPCISQTLLFCALNLGWDELFRPETRAKAAPKGISLAAYFGLTDVFERLFAHYEKVEDTYDDWCGDVMQWAVLGGQKSVLQLTLTKISASTSLNQMAFRQAPLYFAVEQANQDVAKQLVRAGADVRLAVTERGWKRHALHVAVNLSHAYVQLLVDAPNGIQAYSARDERGDVPLHAAINASASDETLQLLLSAGDRALGSHVFDDVQNMFGHNPLHLAARVGHIPSAKILLRHSHAQNLVSESNQKDWKPLTLAVVAGGGAVTATFLEAESQVRYFDNDHDLTKTILECVQNTHDLNSLRLFLRHVAKRANSEVALQSALFAATAAASPAPLEEVLQLLPEDSLLMISLLTESSGTTVLHEACMAGNIEIVNRLLPLFGWVDQQDESGQTALHHAIENGMEQAVEALLAAGADPSVVANNGFRPIDMGIRDRAHNIVSLLTAAGATIPQAPEEDTLLSAAELQAFTSEFENLNCGQPTTEQALDVSKPDKPFQINSTASALPTATPKNWARTKACRSLTQWFDEWDQIIYLQSQAISGPVKRLVITFTSQDQGWSDWPEDHGSYRRSETWFTARRVSPDSQVLGEPLHVQHNIHAGKRYATQRVVFDETGSPDRADGDSIRRFLGSLRVGDRVGLVPRARFPGWQNWVSRAEIEIFTERNDGGE